jgi:hypothetical protein
LRGAEEGHGEACAGRAEADLHVDAERGDAELVLACGFDGVLRGPGFTRLGDHASAFQVELRDLLGIVEVRKWERHGQPLFRFR